MHYSKAKQKNLAEIVKLWHEVFYDNNEDIVNMLYDFVGFENQYVATENGNVLAILSAVPCFLNSQKGVYFFALATTPEMRGKGIMANLMKYAQHQEAQHGAHFVALIPASPSLFDYYLRLGYNNSVSLRVFNWIVKDNPPTNFAVKVSVEELGNLREKMLGQAVITFNKKSTKIIYNDLKLQNVALFTAKNSYALAYTTKSGLKISELVAACDSQAADLLNYICNEFNLGQALVNLPCDSKLFAEQGQKKEYALIKRLTSPIKDRNVYLQFALEDILA